MQLWQDLRKASPFTKVHFMYSVPGLIFLFIIQFAEYSFKSISDFK